MSGSHAVDPVPDVRRRTRHLGLFVLALVAYVPALASSPGRMPADTKLYLYLDPGGLVGRAASTFEADQFAGWVPHQQIAYLWPSGPWFWLFDAIGSPDWIAHRLWIGTIMFAAGAGVQRVGRLLGLAPAGALVGALVYQLSPFLLAYISRTSLLLLPWAALGWIVVLTIRATGPGSSGCRSRLADWRDPAAIALIVATIGAVNATAVALIVPASLLWLVHVAWQGTISWRRAVAVGLRVGVLSFAVSLWWIGMLVVQSRHGAAVLQFSESLEDVSRNSTGSEVLRTLGYWLFYQRDPIGPTTSASLPYLISLRTIAVSYAVILVAMVGLTVVSWSQRRFAAMLMAVGLVLSVGVHPIGDPSPLMSWFTGGAGDGLALALRSSTRAMPVFLLGAALAAGALITALPSHRPRWSRWSRAHRVRLPTWRTIGAWGVGVLALVNLPSLRNFEFVDPAIDRDEQPPDAWTAAAERVDELATGARVLQLPGAEFGAFRWGYTADQPLVGIGRTPLVTRDLLPLGSAPAMDLLYALDDRFQEGTIDVAAVAPLARLLGADTLLLTNDMAFERYRTARPEIVDDLLTGAAHAGLGGLRDVERVGEPVANIADVPMIDATSLLDPRVGQPLNPLTIVSVDDGVGVVRAKTRGVVVSGSGDGIVDAAAVGLLDGHELLRYSASLDANELDSALSEADLLIVTDSNRDRAHHWRGSQDVHGHTEPGGPADDVLVATDADQRLDLFASDDPATQTVAVQEGRVTAIASAYGEPFAYRPEDRAVMAIDRDVDTAWTVGDHGDPVGERIRLELVDGPSGSEQIVVRQPAPADGGRVITDVAIGVDDRTVAARLTPESYGPRGQVITAASFAEATVIEFEITGVSVGDPARAAASRSGVGFSEIDLGVGPTTEFIRVPNDALDRYPAGPLAIVLTRLRVDPTDMWRSDPEPALRRSFSLPEARELDIEVSLRLDPRAADGVLAEWLYGTGAASADRRLDGSVIAGGAAAFDGDPTTAWVTPFDGAVGASVTFEHSGPLAELRMTQPSGDFSPITAITIDDGHRSLDVAVGAPDAAGESVVAIPPGLAPGELTLTISAIEPRSTVNRRYGDVMILPAAIGELSAPGLATGRIDPTRMVTAECAPGLVTLDGAPVGLSFATTTGALLAGDAVRATACAGPVTLAAGAHRIVADNPADSALRVDGVVLTDTRASTNGERIGTTVERDDPRHRTVTVAPCPDGCWLVLGEGFNEAWSASVDGTDLGAPRLVDGGFNGWQLPPGGASTTVELVWTAQTPVTWGLAIGVLTAIGLVAVLVTGLVTKLVTGLVKGRRRLAPTITAPVFAVRPFGRQLPALVVPAVVVPAVVVPAVVFAVSCALLIAPIWALAAVVPAAIGVAQQRWSLPHRLWWLGRPYELLGLAAAVYVAVAVVVIERNDRPFPNAGWTTAFDGLNGVAVMAVLAVAVGAMFGAVRPVPSQR